MPPGSRARRLRRFIATASALVMVTLAVALVERNRLFARFQLRRLSSPEPEQRRRAANALWDLGEDGQRALGRLAFSEDIAEPESDDARAREAALAIIWKHDQSVLEADPASLGDDALVRYLSLARGVRRDDPLAFIATLDEQPPKRPKIREAWLDVMLTDSHEPTASFALRMFTHGLDVPALRRAALEARHASVRGRALKVLARWFLASEEAVFRSALEDTEPAIRLDAATRLAELGRNTGVPTLLRALPESRSGLAELVRPIVTLHDRRAVRALIVCRDRPDCPDPRPIDKAIAALTGHTLAQGESWTSWWTAHEKEFPPQLP
jgi:hypothetical protein